MRHLSNIFNHRHKRARSVFTGYTYQEWQEGPEAIQRAWQRHLDWINQNVIGPPQATKTYTQAELEEMGMIGIYAKESKDQQP